MEVRPRFYFNTLAIVMVALIALVLLPSPAIAAGGTWSNGPNLNTARGMHTAVLLQDGSTVLIAGGYNSAYGYLNSAETYDAASDRWISTSNTMSVARQNFTMTLLSNGKVLVAGGYNSSGYVNSPEIYDPATKSWSLTGAMTTARQLAIAARLPDGRVLVAGGSSSSGTLAAAEIYNPSTGIWSAANPMKTPRVYHVAVTLSDGKILVLGGSSGATAQSAEVYDPATGNWSYAANMPTPRGSGHTATLLADGKVLVAGGYNDSGPVTGTEVYDPGANTWSTVYTMTVARTSHTATLLPDGSVLVVGGYNGYTHTNLSSAEIFDPVSHTFSATASLTYTLSNQTATRVNNRVLVAGGYQYPGQSGALATTEFFTPPPTITRYTLTILPPRYGSVSLSPPQPDGGYLPGTVVTLTPVPVEGYEFDQWGGDLSGTANPATITMDGNETVTATFAIDTFTITANAGAGGSINPSGAVTVNYGASQIFNITPDTGYRVADVMVDGTSVGAVVSCTFSNVTANHTITASFALDVLKAVIDIDPNTLNLKSQSDKNAITAYIELPAGYYDDVNKIDIATLKLNVLGTLINAQLTPTSVGDYDGDKIADRMVKFDRQAVITALAGKTGDISLTITGQLKDGRSFTGSDTIKVINPGK